MSEKGISEKTLKGMDKAAKNLKEGKVSEPINEKLDKYTKGEEDSGEESMKNDEKKPEEAVTETPEDIDAQIAALEAKKTVDDDDEKRSGLKEVAKNADVMAIEKDKESDGEEVLPSFFVEKEDRHDVEIDILSSLNDGKLVSISRHGLGLDFEQFDYLHHSVEKFEFSIPTYDEMSTYRQRSAAFRNEVQQMVVDRVQLRNFFLVWHLKDWTLKDRDGKKVELEHDEDGSLSDASMKKVYSIQPTMVDIVLTLFEKDILLT